MTYSYRIEQAIRAAAMLHHSQTRKGSIPYPYLSHCVSVAMLVSDYTDEEDTLIAAFLHDTLEDTEYTADELEEDFGAKVREIVEGITEPAVSPAVPTHELWKEKHAQYVAKLRDAPLASLIVAAADKIHNMRAIIEEYHKDHTRFAADFGGTREERLTIYQSISNILNTRLQNEIVHEFNHVFEEYKQFIYGAPETKH